jgi:prepilin-type N-terminal cleavage/methylation domain-containing protein
MARSQYNTGRRPRRHAERGFTLPEAIITLALFLLLSAAVVSVYLMSLRSWSEGSAQIALQRKLAAAMQRIVQGERGRDETRQHGLREARDVKIVSPQAIEFTSGIDGTTRCIHIDGNEIYYDPDTASESNEERVVYDPSTSQAKSDTSTYRTELAFTQLSDGTIEIRLVGEQLVRDRWMNAALVTRVAPRN